MHLKESIYKLAFVILISLFFSSASFSQDEVSSDIRSLMPGIPLGGGMQEADLEICPQGANVIIAFLEAWQRGDYETMYYYIDDDSKTDYTFEQARFDLMMLEFKEYKISSVAKKGDDFEFILSYGNYKDGDKDTQKMLISGKTFKIIMPARNSVFKKSAENYF